MPSKRISASASSHLPRSQGVSPQAVAPEIWSLLSLMVIGFELLLGVAFLFRRSQGWAMLAAVAFHLNNTVILFIPEFLVCITIAPIFASDQLLETTESRFTQLCRSLSSRLGERRS